MKLSRYIHTALLTAVLAGACYGQVSINANATLDGASVGAAYNVNLFAAGGTSPYTFTVVAGAVPAGTTLSPSGILSGTPTTAGTVNFTAQVVDAAGASAVKAFTLPVSAAPLTLAPVSGALPPATVGQVYQQQFTASGGSGSYTYLLIATSPTTVNLDLDPQSGAFYGTPFAAQSTTMTVEVVDSERRVTSQTYSLNIQPASRLALGACSALPPITPGANYSGQLVATGGFVPYSFFVPSFASGPLPTGTQVFPGITLSEDGQLRGVLSPSYQGIFVTSGGTFVVIPGLSLVDGAGSSASADCLIPVNIPSSPTITSSSPLPAAVLNTPYQFTVQTGSPSITFSYSASGLPDGLQISKAGVISGSPTVAGTFSVSVTGVGVNVPAPVNVQKTFVLVVDNQALAVTTPATLPPAYPSRFYSQTFAASESPVAALVWLSGAIPQGLRFIGTQLIGTVYATVPTDPYIFTVELIHADGRIATQTFTLNVNTPALDITTSSPLPVGVVGASYQQILQANRAGGSPYFWQLLRSQLPAALTLDGGGFLSGLPGSAFNNTVTVLVGGDGNSRMTKDLQLIVRGQALTITTATVPIGIVGRAYSKPISAIGGAGSPYQFTSTSTLPPGIQFLNGTLTGTPTATGSYAFTVTVTDSDGSVASRSYTLQVVAPLTVPAANLPAGTVSAPYGPVPLAVAGGVAPFAWVLVQGALPQGVTLSPTGVISGTPVSATTASFTAQVSDGSGQVAAGQFQIVVNSRPTVIQTLLPPTTVNNSYGPITLNVVGGVPPYTWSVAGGSLPGGITLSPGGVLSGIATTSGSFSFTAQVTDRLEQSATGQFIVSVNQQIRIIPSFVPSGTVNVVYPPVTFSVDGGGSFNWSAGSGLPPGLTLTPSGILQGTPTLDGVFAFTVTASGQGGTASTTITMRVNPVIGLTGIPIAPIDPNTAVQINLGGTGGKAPYTFTLGGCSIPGLSLSSAGVLAGTATTPGTYNCSITVADSNGASSTTATSITVLPILTISGNFPAGVVNQVYASGSLTASGGKPPYSFSVAAGSLGGLSIDTSGNVTGTPTTAGTFSFTGKVVDAGGASASAQFSIVITGALTITTTQLPDGTLNVVYPPVTLAATGGTKPYTWSASGNVPPGMSLTADGVFAGTPTQLGTFSFTVRVTDAARSSASATFTVKVAAAPLVISANFPPAIAGASYTQTATATGGFGALAWSVASGTLPSGLAFSSTGVLSGTPTASGSFRFTIQVSDSQQPPQSATLPVTLLVNLPPTPPAQVGGLPDTIDAAQQPKFGLSLGTPFPVDITGTLTLTFKSSAVVPADDPAIKFMNGLRTLPFTIPANTTAAVFAVPSILSTGTVAGTITITASLQVGQTDVTPAPAPVRTIVVNAAPPVITSVSASATAGSITVTVQGFATTRQITQAKFHFTPSGATTVQTSDITVDVTSAFTQWYQSAASAAFGSGFSYVQPFTLQGSFTGSVSVTLVNDKGNSNTVSGQF